jgi:hypothetical protein
MDAGEDLRPALRQPAAGLLGRLSPSDREALLIKNWMSHDARWFMAVAAEFGMQVTNRLNQRAAHEVGTVEARRIVRALGLPPVTTLDDYLLVQEVLIGLLGPDLLDYRVTKAGDNAFRIHVGRCFAHDNAARAGVAGGLACGIFARVTGWLEALGLAYDAEPGLDACLMARGEECIHTVSFRKLASPA